MSEVDSSSPSRAVDVHAHVAPAAVAHWPSGHPSPPATLDERLDEHAAWMDLCGIDASVLSVAPPMSSSDTEDVGLCAGANDELAALVASARGSVFGALALLPNDPSAAAAEVDRVLGTRALDGIGMFSNAAGLYPGDQRMRPLIEALDAYGATVFVHPGGDQSSRVVAGAWDVPRWVAELPFDTTRAILSLALSGTLRRFRRITWVFAHGGGVVDALASRLQVLQGFDAGFASRKDDLDLTELDNVFIDTALTHEAGQLHSLARVWRPDQMLLGTDWPATGAYYREQAGEGPASPGDVNRVLDDGYASSGRPHPTARHQTLSLFPRLAARMGEPNETGEEQSW